MTTVAEMKRTQFAQQGLDFVSLFSAKFSHQKFSGYIPQLREPAESTAGGKQAVQHIIMSPTIEGDNMLTVGYVNVATKTGKLRTYDCMAEMHALRFRNQPFVVDAAQYQDFFDKANEFMRRQGMQVQIETRPPRRASSRPPPRPKGSAGADILIWVLLVVIVFGGGLAAYMRITGRL